MLSAEQKKLKSKSKAAGGVLEPGSTYSIRRLSSKYDKDRVAELWANLSMVQQMNGYTKWMDESQKSNLKWNEYIHKLTRARSSRVLVIENPEEIFGFAYMMIESVNAANPKKKTQLKAVIQELYIEPAYRKEAGQIEMAEKMRDVLKEMGIEYIEFDIKDITRKE